MTKRPLRITLSAGITAVAMIWIWAVYRLIPEPGLSIIRIVAIFLILHNTRITLTKLWTR